jgi:hypothetical protein
MEQVEAAPLVPLYPDGATAARVGLAGVKRPGVSARRMSARLVKKGAGKSATAGDKSPRLVAEEQP